MFFISDIMIARTESPYTTHSLSTFCELVYPAVESQLALRRKNFPYLWPIIDPFSTGSCRCAIFSINDATLAEYGVMRAGGYIKLRDHKKGEEVSHAYFASHKNPTAVLDFTAGQIALSMGTTLDEWIVAFPQLFKGRALCADKAIIQQTLGIIYPEKNTEFWDFFHNR